MNWTLIKEKYSKAFELMDMSFDIFWEKDREANKCRFLYDFFDEQGIIIDIAPTFSKEVDGKTEFYIDWWIDDIPVAESREHYKTRTEAEEQAFLKAFEILEAR